GDPRVPRRAWSVRPRDGRESRESSALRVESFVVVELLAEHRKLALESFDLGLVDARIDSWTRRLDSCGFDRLLELICLDLRALVLVFVADRLCLSVHQRDRWRSVSSTALRIQALAVTAS